MDSLNFNVRGDVLVECVFFFKKNKKKMSRTHELKSLSVLEEVKWLTASLILVRLLKPPKSSFH